MILFFDEVTELGGKIEGTDIVFPDDTSLEEIACITSRYFHHIKLIPQSNN